MIKTAKITILDTGYLTSAREGTPKSGNNLADLENYICNQGNPITLAVPKMSLDGNTNISAEPNPSSNKPAATSVHSFENNTYDVSFIINVQDSSDRLLLKEINALSRTLGVKLLYSSDTDTNIKTLPELLGRTDTRFNTSPINGVTLSVPVFVCRVKDIHIDNIPSSRKYAITGKLTLIEEKVII